MSKPDSHASPNHVLQSESSWVAWCAVAVDKQGLVCVFFLKLLERQSPTSPHLKLLVYNKPAGWSLFKSIQLHLQQVTASCSPSTVRGRKTSVQTQSIEDLKYNENPRTGAHRDSQST